MVEILAFLQCLSKHRALQNQKTFRALSFLLTDALGALCVVGPCGGVVEEGGAPPLGELHGGADSRVEEVPDRGGAPVRERQAGSLQIAADGVGVLHELMLQKQMHLMYDCRIPTRIPVSSLRDPSFYQGH